MLYLLALGAEDRLLEREAPNPRPAGDEGLLDEGGDVCGDSLFAAEETEVGLLLPIASCIDPRIVSA